MVFQTIGEAYGKDGLFKSIVNSAGIYTGLRLAGNAVAHITGNQEFDHVIDMVAPVATGVYAVSRSPKDSFVGNMAQLGIVALVGWDFADQLVNYTGNITAIKYVSNALQNTYNMVSPNLPGFIGSPQTAAAATTSAMGGLAQIVKGARKEAQKK